MAELIAACGKIPWYDQEYKRLLLSFDKLACPVIREPKGRSWREIPDVTEFLESRWSRNQPWFSDCCELVRRGLLFSINPSAVDMHIPENVRADLLALDMTAAKFEEFTSTYDPYTIGMKRYYDENAYKEIPANARALALRLRVGCNMNAVPATTPWDDKPLFESASRESVLHLVISGIPVPSDDHSLADILAFKDEMRSMGLTQHLHVWINEVASGKLTGFEVSDKLEHLMSQYQRTLELEKMRRRTTLLETFVFPAQGVIEYLTALGSKLFNVRRAELDLMKAEMTAPGREVAYIVRARDRFGRE